MKILYLLSFISAFFFILEDLQGQNFIDSRQTSYYTYIYQLSDEQAFQIYKKGMGKVEDSYFKTLIQTYPTDSIFDEELPPGHYLFAWASNENLNFELASISNVGIKVFNNGADMNLLLHDEVGREINEAKVKIDGKRIPFKEKTGSYFLKRSNKRGMLEVEYQGIKTFTYLDRQLNNPKLRRFSRKILYSVPIKYLWIPLSTVLQSPYDLYKSVRAGRPSGVFYYVAKPFQGIVRSISWGEPQGFVQKVFCPFDNYYCEHPQFDGYLIFNKPKYRPGDTVRVKAFITNKKGKPINRRLNVSLYGRYNSVSRKDLGTLSPYRKGGYAFEFHLHDSLELKLDARYTLDFEGRDFNTYINGDFELEEYELKSNIYEFRADKNAHYKGQGVSLYASGTDINGLNLFDAQLEITVLSKGADKIFAPQVIFSDTLWHYQQKLESVGETKITLPDSIFPQANFNYEVVATFTNSENEKKYKELNLSYSHHKESLVVEAIEDSLFFKYQINGIEHSAQAKVTMFNEELEEMDTMNVNLPFVTKLNPFVFRYKIESQDKTKNWDLTNVSSQLEVLSNRTSDSLFITVKNPRQLYFRYFIYEKDKEISKGSGTELNFKYKNRIKGKYFISLHHVWAGEAVSENYEISFKEKQLQIKVFEPGTIFPGQESEIKVMVQDAAGKAVENADISAFAFTKKFERANIPLVPYFGRTYKNRTLVNNFEDIGNELQESVQSMQLNWQMWNARMALDSIAYYRFLFPHHNYATAIDVGDTITQFAPYLVREGTIQPIHIIYLDNKPVYLSAASRQRYSFPATPGYHQLRLRTNEFEVKIDSVHFVPQVKNIFSFLMDTVNRRVQLIEKSSQLSDHEERLVKSHLIAIENKYLYTKPSYLKQNRRIYWTNQQTSNQRNVILGPVYAGLASFVDAGADTIDFSLEQGYLYSFKKNLIKMKYGENMHFSRFLNNIGTNQPLNEKVLTEKELTEIFARRAAERQSSWRGFINPTVTTNDKGKIQVMTGVEALQDNFIKNLILLKDNQPQFLQIYSGSASTIHDLLPGEYALFFLLDDNSYYYTDKIKVLKNASTYIDFKNDTLQFPEQRSFLINEKIKEIQETDNYSIPGRNEDFREIKNIIATENRVNRYLGETIFGVVRDKNDGMTLPGVTVLIKGTNIGTITNLDGEYSIDVPERYNTLTFSFIGYVSEEIAIGAIREMNVMLTADVTELQEVVVVGYGMQKKQSLTGSVTTIESGRPWPSALEGKVAGITISGAPGANHVIQVRGNNTVDASTTPLYVIDGVPYSGDDLEISPEMIKSIEVLKAGEAAAIYGSRAINGVVLIRLKPGAAVLKTVMANNTFMEAMDASSSIRSNFSDYAYWEPKLKTDENGITSFIVKFPDDITAWNTHVLGMTDKRQSGQYQGEIKAFKTVAGTLATPTFLTEGDSTAVIGKALNYTSDSLEIAVMFEVDSTVNFTGNYKILHSKIDTLAVVASLGSDSVGFQYTITKKDGYFDGERRKIPVYRKGIKETIGNFYVLEKDTTIAYVLPFSDKPFKVAATSNVLQVLMEEADNIRRYEYLCNEQMASKIKALLVLKQIKEFKGEDFKYEGLIKRLINNLQKTQRKQLWGWWAESPGSYWISLHVLEALLEAEKEGYKTSIHRQPIIDVIAYNLDTKAKSEQIRILKILSLLEAPFAYKAHLDSLESKKLALSDYIEVQLLKQAFSLPYNVDSLLHYQKETLFGGVYWEEPKMKVYSNEVLTTINAYKLLKNTGKHDALLPKIRNYFLESRRNNGYWRNTYEASKILETILPDLLQKDANYKKVKLTINKADEIEKFPFERAYDPGEEVTITKTGTGPLFLSVHQDFWNEEPEKVEEDFIITSSFEEGKTTFLAGKEETLDVNLKLKNDVEYIMLEIPIPAGFSYASKDKQRFEDHREHYKNKVNIYFTRLAEGSYDFQIKLLPRFSGTYHLNPAKAELMYFPMFHGRNEGKRVEVR